MAMLAAMPLYAQLTNEPPPALGYGYNAASSSYMEFASSGSGGTSYTAPPPSYTLYGYNTALSKYFPICVDSSGNICNGGGGAAAGSLTGTTLAANVVSSSLTSAAGGTFGTGAYATISNYLLTTGNAATASSLSGGFASGAGQPYNSASSTTYFVYPATDTAMLTLDGNRTDSYTADGTIERPYKTLPTLVAGFPSSGLVSVFSSPNASYTAPSAVTLPALPLTIYGNNSTWTPTGGLTISAKIISYDLIDGAAVTYNYASTDRSEKHGGAFLGNVNVTQGYLHAFGTNLSGNSNIFTVGGVSTSALLYGEAITGSQTIASGGSGALIALYNPNMTKSSGYNIDMTNGGQLLLNGGLLSTVAGTANINLPTANTLATAHAISGLIAGTGTGISCANGTTTYVVYGFNLAPISSYCTLVPGYQGPTNFLGPTHSITTTSGAQLTIQTDTTGAITVDSGTTGSVNLGTGAYAKSVVIGNTTGATRITEQVGTLGYTLTTVGASPVTIAAANTTGAIAIGGTAQTGTMTLGSSSGTNTEIIAGGTGITTLQLANAQVGGSVSVGAAMTTGTISIGGTGAQTGTIAIAPGTGAEAVTIATTATGVKTVGIGNTVSGSKVNIAGEIDGVAAGAGYIGQPLSSLIPSGSAVSLTTGTPANVTSIALTAGDWDVEGTVDYVASTASIAVSAVWESGINTTTAALPTDGTEVFYATPAVIATTSFKTSLVIPRKIINVSAGTTVYLVTEATFTAGTVTAYGSITARRVH